MQTHHTTRFRRAALLLLVLLTLLIATQVRRAPASGAPAAAAPTARRAPTQAEEIASGYSPRALAANSTHLFVASGGYGLESCGFDPGQSTTVLRRLNFDGSGSLSLLERCAFLPGGLLVDDAYVYLKDGDNDLKRMPTGGGALEVIATDLGSGGLTQDATHLYWASNGSAGSNDEIYRWPKAGGPAQLIGSYFEADNAYFMRGIAVDATHVYWLASKIGNEVLDEPGGATLRRMPLAGGAIEIIADAGDGLDDARALTLDATHVYFTEIGTGRTGRLLKNGNNLTFLTPNVDPYMAGALAVNANDLYWADSTGGYDGRIRRMPKAGGSVDDLALGTLGPGGIVLTDSHVYWTLHGAIMRLPLGAAGVAVDLQIDHIEINQVVQDFANSVTLVRDKPTLVRVYASIAEQQGQLPGLSVAAELHGERDGIAFPDSPLKPYNGDLFVRYPDDLDRWAFDESYYFWLPPHWRHGNVEFTAVINPDGAINEFNSANNSITLTRNFNDNDPLCVEMVSIRTDPQTATADDAAFWEVINTAEQQLPYPEMLIDVGGTIEETQVCWWGIVPYPCGGPYELTEDAAKVVARLGWYSIWHTHNQWQQCGPAHFYGMGHMSEASQGGMGNRPGYAAYGIMNNDPDYNGWEDGANFWYAPHGGSTMAHELGHNKNRKHVDCGDPDGVDNSYPYNPCNIDAGFSQWENFGLDTLQFATFGPTDVGDLMSYAMSTGKPRWPSDYTYEAMLDYPFRSAQGRGLGLGFDDFGRAISARAAAADPLLALTGIFSPTAGTATFDFAFAVPAGTLHAQKLSAFAPAVDLEQVALDAGYLLTLELRAADSSIIQTVPFSPPVAEDGPDDVTSFTLVLPWSPATAQIVLRNANGELAKREASANAPKVTVTSPNGGESFAGSLQIDWAASDADGDALVYTVQYSADGGTTWNILATDVYTPQLVLNDVSFIPGTLGAKALVRVIASDGLLTGSDVSDAPFALRNNPPRARIDTPTAGSVFDAGVTIAVKGGAADEEDGQVAPAGLSWQLNGAPVGSGSEIALDNLPVGVHTLQLLAIDSGGLSDTAAVSFIVRAASCGENDARLHVAFLIDFADPAMSAWNPTACAEIPDWIADLADLGLIVDYDVIGINGRGLCATTSVGAIDPATTVDHVSDWGPAIESVAAHLDWTADATRVMVPITNQGPQNGNPTSPEGADGAAAAAAIADALKHGVSVTPLLAPPTDSQNQARLEGLAALVATQTGGGLLRWDDRAALPATLQTQQATLACSPLADSAPQHGGDERRVALRGVNLWPGTQVDVDGAPASDVATSPDGRALTFTLPTARAAGGVLTLSRAGAPATTYDLASLVPTAVTTLAAGSTQPASVWLPLLTVAVLGMLCGVALLRRR